MNNIYLVAYGCEPNQGGEHEVGWKIANELQDKCNLTVITRKSNKKIIEQNNNKNIKFIFIENEFFLRFKPKGKFSYFYYIAWQWSVFLYLKNRVKNNDIVHYLTFGNIHLPHFLFLLKSKLVIGPMGGGSVTLPCLIKNPPIKEKIKYIMHSFINHTVKLNPIYYWLFFKSSKIILRTKETLDLVPKICHSKCEVFLETGIDVKNINYKKKNRKLKKIITTGKFIPLKNMDQVIEVFLKLRNVTNNFDMELYLAGNGPLKKFLENKYSAIDGVKFLGKVPHEKVKELLKEADLFLFCSVKEGGSHSLFEAAMSNLPIACYDVSGMTEFPKNNSAIKVKPTCDIDKNIENLAKKIITVFSDNEKIEELCENAIKDLKENYDWRIIAERYLKIYNEILKEK